MHLSTHTHTHTHTHMAHSAGAIEYTEGQYSFNECPGYDTKQSDGESPVILRMQRTPLLPSLPGVLWPEW